jgi:N-acetylglucosaminyldiphosphoundecaprenol N-acetyl-beta-D-mannosaminyltransferase
MQINTINAHSFNVAQRDKDFARALMQSGAVLPDGVGIVLAWRWLFKKRIARITGWDLFRHEMHLWHTQAREENAPKKVFMLGSSEAVLEKMVQRALEEYPMLEVHTYSPPYKPEFSEAENAAMIEAVNRVRPEALFIGMTAPKQEKWAFEHFDELDVLGHICTVGAVFDFYAGTVKRAPRWWQRHGLEWLYRFLMEPRRMCNRYLVGNVKFIYFLLSEKKL